MLAVSPKQRLDNNFPFLGGRACFAGGGGGTPGCVAVATRGGVSPARRMFTGSNFLTSALISSFCLSVSRVRFAETLAKSTVPGIRHRGVVPPACVDAYHIASRFLCGLFHHGATPPRPRTPTQKKGIFQIRVKSGSGALGGWGAGPGTPHLSYAASPPPYVFL